MGERKVLNKYYPPDFDPALLPRRKMPKDKQFKVRIMLPMSVRCTQCGEYLYQGKKFNARKETCLDEDYLGIRIFRFYFKCTSCSAELTMKTDPKNADYIAEHNITRNFEQWKADKSKEEEIVEQREREEKGDAMKVLENRTKDSKIEMDILDALDEMKCVNNRRAQINLDDVLAAHHSTTLDEIEKSAELDDDEEQEVQKAFKARVRRLDDEDDEEVPPLKKQAIQKGGAATSVLASTPAAAPAKALIMPKFTVAAKPVVPEPPKSALAMLGDYGDSSSGGDS